MPYELKTIYHNSTSILSLFYPNSLWFVFNAIVVAVNKQIEIKDKSTNTLFNPNELNFEGKYRAIDKDKAIAKAPPLIIWFRID